VKSTSETPIIPERFRVAGRTLLMDRFMNQFIKVGGAAVIIAVFGIFFFILVQILPLFKGARVEPLQHVTLPEGDYLALGIDEWSELPFVVRADGTATFIDIPHGGRLRDDRLPYTDAHGLGAIRYDQAHQRIALGTRDGHFAVIDVDYRPTFDANNERTIAASLKAGPLFPIGRDGQPIIDIGYADAGQRKLAVAIQETPAGREIHAVTLKQKRSLIGRGKTTVDKRLDLTGLVPGTLKSLHVAAQADAVIVETDDGILHYLFFDGHAFDVRQTFQPFADLSDPRIATVDFIFGDVTLVATSVTGETRGYSLYLQPGGENRLFGRTKTFPSLPAAAETYARSVRNKAFLLTAGSEIRLLYSTTETLRWAASLPYQPVHTIIGGKYDRLALLDREHRLHFLQLDDPHPESGWRAFFGKIWYEGGAAPEYAWQSTGGSDDFEPKLSLVPLIIGSLKGTLYALIFAVPIALLAALYTSQFLKPEIKAVVKPTMEIMASLPSVVLGFLAALWLAPILETRVPSILCIAILTPLAAILAGWGWTHLPPNLRHKIRPGWEFLAFSPILVVVVWLGWVLGPVIERLIFVVTDPETGARVADFRLWWPRVTGTTFEQRNSLVVGFMMGFAVIPIIFTIAEDALSNVPKALRSGSLALGASRWQTAWRIVLPTASAGIFSALMIGLGRAVGETMIVVMATGNTPIMEWNIFSGMRTLSANIAVELPEAPHHSTLYRTLFFGAMVLFVLTFLVNTFAEILRQRLRERYKTVE